MDVYSNNTHDSGVNKADSMDKEKNNENEIAKSIESLNLQESSSGEQGASVGDFKRKPVIIIVVGMAGGGKTTCVHGLFYHMSTSNVRGYTINLDPGVVTLPFPINIDIRDTIRYKEVMKQFNLGPNGGILTSLNLFATKFDEVISVLERRAGQLDYVLIDTPGQIEIFTWSASGAIITEALASTFPTVIAYVVDTPRSVNPSTFMSNMLYACSILYKTRLPLVLVFNKIDVAQHTFALEWMKDFELFQTAIDGDSSYTSTLTRSLSLALESFYNSIPSVGVSSVCGSGMVDFFKAVDSCVEEYMENYRADLEKRKAEKKRMEEEQQRVSMERLRRDMGKCGGESVVLSTGLRGSEVAAAGMEEEEEEEDDYQGSVSEEMDEYVNVMDDDDDEDDFN